MESWKTAIVSWDTGRPKSCTTLICRGKIVRIAKISTPQQAACAATASTMRPFPGEDGLAPTTSAFIA